MGDPTAQEACKKLPEIIAHERERQARIGRPVRLMFEDEARFGRINDPRRCWAPRGIRPIVGRRIVREYTYACAVVSPHNGILDSLVLPTVAAETMSFFLTEVARRHPHAA